MTKRQKVGVVVGAVILALLIAGIAGWPWYQETKANEARIEKRRQEMTANNPKLYEEIVKGRDVMVDLVKKEPGKFDYVVDLANNYQILGDYVNAEKYYYRAIAITPLAPRAWSNLATIYRETGRYPEARQAYESYIQHVPDDMNGYIGLAEMYIQGREGTKDDAVRVMEQGVQKNPNNQTLKEYLERLRQTGQF